MEKKAHSAHTVPSHLALNVRNYPHEVIQGVWMWSVFSEEKGLDFNGYLVQTGEDEAFITDPPCAGAEVLEAFAALPRPRFIAITNADHQREAGLFREHFGVPVYAPSQDAGLLDFEPDRLYGDGDELADGWRVIHLPHQKTPGESALYQPQRQLLILGDALIGKPTQRLSMLPDEKYADKLDAIQGLQRLTGLAVQAVLPGDGDPLMLNVRDEIAEALLERTRE